MRILQVTNIISPHQIPLAKQLALMVGENNFRFAAIAPPDPERLRLGWKMAATEAWILRPSELVTDMDEFDRWWKEADVVLCGERLFHRMSQRLDRNQLCFYMSERWWKPRLGRSRLLWPKFFRLALEFRHLTRDPNFHYLSIGPFAARDIATLAQFNNRIWQWGYFTDFPEQESLEPLLTNKIKLLWVGRMLGWKRVDMLIKAAATLHKSGTLIELTLVGDGPKRSALEGLANKILGNDVVKFIDPLPSSEIISIMRRHNVYVLPSNAYEGWGAVINEAMSAGLSVVASNQAGSAAAMINHGSNGLLFESGVQKDLESCLFRLSNNNELRHKLSSCAKETIAGLWSPQIAAKRLIEFSEELLNKNQPARYSNGPMASARTI